MLPKFDPMDHFNPPEDELAILQLDRVNLAKDQHPIAVEIGAWAGSVTRILAQLGYRVYAVDPWTGNPDDRLGEVAQRIGQEKAYATFCKNMGSMLIDRVVPLMGTSEFWAKHWPLKQKIGFLYIDGDHRYEHVLHDIRHWSRFVAKDGVIAGHDFGYFEGVTKAVEATGRYGYIEGTTVWFRFKE